MPTPRRAIFGTYTVMSPARHPAKCAANVPLEGLIRVFTQRSAQNANLAGTGTKPKSNATASRGFLSHAATFNA